MVALKLFLQGLIFCLIGTICASATTPYCQSAHKAVACVNSIPGNDGNGNFVLKDICDVQGIASNSTAHYVLASNIDATCTALWNNGAGFTPIGGTFTGTIEGNGFRINGLYIRSSAQNVGLFQTIGRGATIDNLALTNVRVSGAQTMFQGIGALAGTSYGTLSFVYVSGCVGDVTGCMPSTTSNSSASVGGIVSGNIGTISNAFFNGTVYGPNAGGIANTNDGIIQYSASAGVVTAQQNVGGILSYNNGSALIQYSWSSATTTGSFFTGGLVGANSEGNVLNSYAIGNVNGQTAAGGLIGAVYPNSGGLGGNITSVFSAGTVRASGMGVGGLIGSSAAATYSNAYWDKQQSRQAASAGGVAQTTRQLQEKLPAGFDGAIWSDVKGSSYPFIANGNCTFAKSPIPAYCAPVTGAKTESCPKINTTVPEPEYYCQLTGFMTVFQPVLALLAPSTGLYAVIPMGQLQLFQYAVSEAQAAAVAPQACGATVYAMIARLVGAMHPDALVIEDAHSPNFCGATESASAAHIDCLMSTGGGALWPSLTTKRSIANYVTFTPALPLGSAGTPLVSASDDSAAETLVETGLHPLILHGSVPAAGGGTTDHWVLVTGVVKALPGDPSALAGTVIRLVANDPELGQQIFIDINPNDNTDYHQAVLNVSGRGDRRTYVNLTRFTFLADSYRYLTLN